MEARIAAIRAEFEAEETEAQEGFASDEEMERRITEDRAAMARSRRADGANPRQNKA
jgi:hypothetical protein